MEGAVAQSGGDLKNQESRLLFSYRRVRLQERCKEKDPTPQFKATAELGKFLEARFSRTPERVPNRMSASLPRSDPSARLIREIVSESVPATARAFGR